MKKKVLMKMSGLLLAAVLVASSGAAQFVLADTNQETEESQDEEKMIIYLDGKSGSDKNSGEDSDHAVKTFSRAAELTGEYGVIRICGTVTIKSEVTWELPNGVSVRRAEDFDGPLVKVTAKGELTLENVRMYKEDIDGEGKVEGAIEREKVSVPKQLVVETPVPLSEIPLTKCEGDGVFVWEEEDFVPSEYETECTVVFYPYDGETVDYSEEKGWDEERKVVVRKVTLQVESLKPVEEEPVDPAPEPDVTEQPPITQPPVDETTPSVSETPSVPETTPSVPGNVPAAPETTPSAPEAAPSAPETPETMPPADVSVTDPAAPTETPAAPESGSEPGQNDQNSTIIQGIGSGMLGGNTTSEGETQESPLQTVTAQIMALPDVVDSQEAVLGIVEATKAYEALTDLQKELLSPDVAARLASLQEAAGVYNRQCDDVTLEGDIPWYVQLRVAHTNDRNDVSVLIDYNVDTFITPYDLSLWDLLSDCEYHLNGQQVKITMPSPDKNLYQQLVIVHYLSDGTVEYLTPIDNGDNTITFLTTSFSPYNIAGSKVLVGSTDKLYGTSSTSKNNTSSGSSSSKTGQTQKNNSSSQSKSGGTKNSGTKSNGTKTISASKNPATGDTTGSVVVFAILAAGAAAVIVVAMVILLVANKRNKEREKKLGKKQ